ncbi:DUF1156 domain-containing protein [Kineococcus arenarius]|uniref:DUF1156 domain-containing protein n=1 Tax=Kineococcus sp. SYSU DK007 TaxID=3383128 RepID=UPI003D7EA1C7
MPEQPVRRKLIEVALPLEAINKESAREKSIRHGHPSTLHLWWARRPLAAARAVLFAQLVDDPSSHPELFPTEAEQEVERKRLHALIEELVVWENAGDEKLMARAHAEIVKSAGPDGPPPILDPFAGGGTIPLEAQRLGLEAHASDLNPVAVLINKALIEIPPKFAGQAPVHPDAPPSSHWPRATGLAEDVRRYGQWMRDEAEKRIGHLYPKADLGNGEQATVIAWIWARTVQCPNPACGIQMPLVRSWWLGKKKGKEAYVVPEVVDGEVRFSIGRDPSRASVKADDGTTERRGATCVACGAFATQVYLKAEGVANRMGQRLLATVAAGKRSRVYLEPDTAHEQAANVPRPGNGPQADMSTNPRWFSPPGYGMTAFADLFTPRQLTALTTFSDLVGETRTRVLADARVAGLTSDPHFAESGSGVQAYADAVATYLGLAVSRTADLGNSLVTWSNSRDQARNLFARQAIPMAWDFVEVSPFARAAGSVEVSIETAGEALETLPARRPGISSQASAAVRELTELVSTDPPYYDNIGYSDLSDFFYVWLRQSLRAVHPELLGTLLTPKADELVANPYRHGGRDGARDFFEDGFTTVFARARKSALPDYPITVYYAFKQSESDVAGEASTGWETLLEGMIRSGWSITSTWPLRSERTGRMISVGTNALASSIVLSLRPRPDDAPVTDRRGFTALLHRELPDALRTLQQGAIAPVDLPQAAIGPGMAVFSRHARVLEDDGSTMSVRAALVLVNAVLDEVLNEQEGDFDVDTRFAIAWFRQRGFAKGPYGDAEQLASARNTSVAHMHRLGIVSSGGGEVRLLAPTDLPQPFAPSKGQRVTAWEYVLRLAHAVAEDGIPGVAQVMRYADQVTGSDVAKELAFLLFSLAESRGMTEVAIQFNALGTAWNQAQPMAQADPLPTQGAFDFTDED